jgi:post-segregation antitoxin (ccd killing protein)
MALQAITIELPDDLLERAQAEGVELTPQTIARMLEAEMARMRSARFLREAMVKLDGALTEEEVEAELASARQA